MKLVAAALAGALLIIAPAAFADVFITDYYGFSWETTPGGAYVPLQAGNVYQMTGTIDAMLPPLVFNTNLNEYTFVISNAVQVGPKVVAGSGSDFRGPYTTYQITYADGALFQIYEDPIAGGTHYNWGVNPPNATSPATFADGALYLNATSVNFVAYINVYSAGIYAGQEIGSFDTNLKFVGGTHVGDVGGVGATGYNFAGLTKNPHASIPLGYKERVDGQQFVTATQPTTWGKIKNLF